MEFRLLLAQDRLPEGHAVVVGVFTGQRLSQAAQRWDEHTEGAITRCLAAGDITGKLGQILLLTQLPNHPDQRILVVGCGDEMTLSATSYRQLFKPMWEALASTRIQNLVCTLPELAVQQHDLYLTVRTAVEEVAKHSYQFHQFKTQAPSPHPVQQLALSLPSLSAAEHLQAAEGLQHGQALAKGLAVCQDLGNLPPNICHPTYMAEQAQQLSRYAHINVEVLQRADMAQLGMNAFLAVGQGSSQPPTLSVIHYQHPQAADQAPIVLVGKGITFDSGGISLKPGEAMDEMKYDMCGAASVMGTLTALAELQLPLHVIGVLACAENMPDGNAYRPGDILTSLSGQTIEVLNTDAEGRLVLCDALTYVERYQPACVIDIATLTGACIVALGHHTSGLLANDEALAQHVLAAAKQANDRTWQLPLDEIYQEQLSSPFADMTNLGGRPAGTITAAAFLSRFAKKYPWAHLDIAGTAWQSGKQKGATGRPVPLLVQFLLDRTTA